MAFSYQWCEYGTVWADSKLLIFVFIVQIFNFKQNLANIGLLNGLT